MIGIDEFITDPLLLGAHFIGASWDRWRAVLKAAFALPMSDLDLALFREVAGNRGPPRHRVSSLVCAIGRGGGKDAVATAVGAFVAVTGDFSRLRVGERAVVLLLATDRDQAAIAFNYLRGYFEQVPLLAGLVERISGDTIELRNGASIVVGTNNIRAPRGWTICAALYDECAFWHGADYAAPDVEVDSAVSPGLMRFSGSMKIIISSVHRKQGLLYDQVAQFFGRDDDDTLVVMGESLQFNPTLDAAVIERELARDPERAGAEYLSKWRHDLTNFLDRGLVEAAIEKGITVRPPQRGVQYRMFADPSGGRNDSFTAAVGHMEGTLAVIDACWEKRAPFDSDAALDEVADLAHSYRCTTVLGDAYGADLTVAAFRRRGLAFENLRLRGSTSPKLSRSEIYLNSVTIFTAGRARLPDNPRLVHQLISLERRAARSGHDTVDHPSGGFDDVANAVCGCLVMLAGRPNEAERWIRAFGDSPPEPAPAPASAPPPETPPEPELVLSAEPLRPMPATAPYRYDHDTKQILKLMKRR